MQRESCLSQNVLQPDDGMQRDQCGRVGSGIKADHSTVGDEAIGTFSAKTQLPAAPSADEARACQVSQCLSQLALVVAHDHDDALGKRGGIVAAGAAVEVTDSS